jgi:regulator of protease activity HflC (stomatin/prohibitin superfamily)
LHAAAYIAALILKDSDVPKRFVRSGGVTTVAVRASAKKGKRFSEREAEDGKVIARRLLQCNYHAIEDTWRWRGRNVTAGRPQSSFESPKEGSPPIAPVPNRRIDGVDGVVACPESGLAAEETMDWISLLAIPIILYVLVSLRVLKQYERGVVFLLGRFAGVRGPGLTMIFVPVQQMVRVSLRTVTMQIPSQKIITRDNVSIDIAAVAYYHISDPERAVIAIENVYNAINQISQTTVRNVVGRFSLDQLLSDTSSINDQIKNVIDLHTEPWGTQVTAVEIKDITLPENMQRAMAREAEAERERRAKIVAAEGEYQAAVKLGEAADIITQHPVALQLRTLQTMAEISIEKNSTIIFPAQFMTTVQEALAMMSKDSAAK